MARPVVGVIGNSLIVENRFPVQSTGERNLRALAEVAGAMPLIFPGLPGVTDLATLLDTVDGILLTGARANVHPSHFNTEPHPKHEPYDQNRDSVALALCQACVERTIPCLASAGVFRK